MTLPAPKFRFAAMPWFGKVFPLFLSAYFLLAPAVSDAQVRSRLQWFDSRGEIIDLDWATSVQWTWSQERNPVAQVIITVPEQLNLISSDETQARFMNGIPDREGKTSNHTLVVEMEGPRKTVKLKKLDPTSDAREIGLTILLHTNSPNVVPSESCAKESISVEPRQAEANFIFLAASCKKIAGNLRISLETSNDALLGKDEDETLSAHSAANPLVILVPKKTVETLKQDMVVATVKAESQTTPPITTQFELVYTKADDLKEDAHLTKAAALPAAPRPMDQKPWIVTAELGLGYLGYQIKKPLNGQNPNEYNLGGKLTAEHSFWGSRTHFKGDLEIPLITLMPDAHFPASGFYKGTARASFTVFDRGKIAFHIEPGLEMGGASYRNRPDIEGFYVGPVVAAYLTGTVGGLSNRAMGLLFSVSPLAGRGVDPFFHTWDISTELSAEVVKGEAEKRWDLVLRFDYLNFHSPSSVDARSTETMLGLRTGL